MVQFSTGGVQSEQVWSQTGSRDQKATQDLRQWQFKHHQCFKKDPYAEQRVGFSHMVKEWDKRLCLGFFFTFSPVLILSLLWTGLHEFCSFCFTWALGFRPLNQDSSSQWWLSFFLCSLYYQVMSHWKQQFVHVLCPDRWTVHHKAITLIIKN